MTDTKQKIVVIGHNLQDKSSIYTMLASKDAEIVVVDNIEQAKEIIDGTSYPVLKPPEPFIIKAPSVIERTFEDYKSGQELRRERRKNQRKSKTKQ